MLLPYSNDNTSIDAQSSRLPVATIVLLAIHLALMLVLIAADHGLGSESSGVILHQFGIVPGQFRWYSLFTYLFFHAGIGHLLTNLFYLWVFGPGVEAAIGRNRFLVTYIAGGAFGGLLQCLVTVSLLSPAEAMTPIVGASAACAGIIGLYAARYYRTYLSFVGLPIRINVVSVVSIYLAAEIGLGLYALVSRDPSDGVAHWAHIGGFTFGLVVAQILRLPDAGERAYLGVDAARAIRRSDPGEAIRRCEALLRRDPENLGARVDLARAWLEFGDCEQASEHYGAALSACLKRNERLEASKTYVEYRSASKRIEIGNRGNSGHSGKTASGSVAMLDLAPSLQFTLGLALEEAENYEYAAELFRAVTLYHPDSPEAEMSLLKVAGIYVHRLHRFHEAQILVQLFLQRYPASSFRTLAEEIRKAAGYAN